MELSIFLTKLRTAPETVSFNHTIDTIQSNFDYIPTAFRNGEISNAAGQNEGSCKVFSFAKIHALSEQETLYCFGDFYREDVLKNPQGSDHGNIRNFIRHGWSGIEFESTALTPKQI